MISELEPIHASEFDAQKASHLLRRTVIGARTSEIKLAVRVGLDATMKRLFTPFEPDRSTIQHMIGNKVWSESRPHSSPRWYGFFDEKNGRYIDLRTWICRTIVNSPTSLQERMTLMWHMHFPSSCGGSHFAEHCLDQNEVIRKHCLGDLRELVSHVTYGQAMQIYLDGVHSFWNEFEDAVNENHAREFLEIHLLGHSSRNGQPLYTQKDIVEIAHAFTGTYISEEWARHDASSEDLLRNRECSWSATRWNPRQKNIMGMIGAWEPSDVVPIVFQQRPSDIAWWFAKRICEEFVTRPTELSDHVVDGVAELLLESDFNIGITMRTLLKSKLFYDQRYRSRLVKTPMHLWLGSLRMLDVKDVPDFYLQSPRYGDDLMWRLSAFGHVPYDPPNVSGWHRDLDWLTPSDVSRRIAQCSDLVMGNLTFKQESTEWRVNLFDPVAFVSRHGTMENVDVLSATLCNDILGTDDPDMLHRLRSLLRSRPIRGEAREQLGLEAVMSSPFYQLF